MSGPVTPPGLFRPQVNSIVEGYLADYFTSDQVNAILVDYYTITEVNSALAGKSDTGHLHDTRYYTETEVDAFLSGKSDTSHLHDTRYYTETEVDTLLGGKSDTGHNHDSAYASISHTHDDRYYTEAEVDALLAGYAAVSHVHSATDVTSGIFDNARINWDSPAAIGGTSPEAGTFTTLAGTALSLTGASGGGYLQLPDQASAPSALSGNLRLYADGSNRLAWRHATGFAAILETSGFTADRTLTFPNASGTLVTQAATQTLVNKTLTSPTLNTPAISGGTIDNTVIGGTTKAAGSFTTLTAWHPAPTGTAGGITLKGYNPNEGGYASMELAGTGPGWTLGKGIIFDNYAANIRFGSNIRTPVIAADIAWLGSSSYQATDPALTVVGNSGRIDMQALLYASGPYPALAISAPELRINTKAAAAWSDGGSGFTGYGTERLRVNDAGLRVEAASAVSFGDETSDNSWRIVRSGSDLVIQRRVSGSWVTKQTITA